MRSAKTTDTLAMGNVFKARARIGVAVSSARQKMVEGFNPLEREKKTCASLSESSNSTASSNNLIIE